MGRAVGRSCDSLVRARLVARARTAGPDRDRRSAPPNARLVGGRSPSPTSTRSRTPAVEVLWFSSHSGAGGCRSAPATSPVDGIGRARRNLSPALADHVAASSPWPGASTKAGLLPLPGSARARRAPCILPQAMCATATDSHFSHFEACSPAHPLKLLSLFPRASGNTGNLKPRRSLLSRITPAIWPFLATCVRYVNSYTRSQGLIHRRRDGLTY